MTGRGTAFDVAVVGAGIVGCAVARAAARAGLGTVLLDRGEIGGAVSGASLACISTHMTSRDELPLLLRAAESWRRLDAESDLDFEYRACGQLRFVHREADVEVAREWVAHERAHGLDPRVLDPAEVRELVPALRGRLFAATWSPADATVNPFLACRALVEDARRAGCTVRPRTTVDAVLRENARVTGIVSGAQHLGARWVINAAGPWAAGVAVLAGCEVPIVPRKAQCLATVALPPVIPCVVGACKAAGGIDAGYTQIQQAMHGQVLFNTVLPGGLRADGGHHDTGIDRQFVVDSIETLLWLFPGLGGAQLLRSWVAYEAVTPDHRFILGPVDGVEGFLMAAGDNGSGFNRALVYAEMLVAWMTRGESPAMAPYLAARFGATRGSAT